MISSPIGEKILNYSRNVLLRGAMSTYSPNLTLKEGSKSNGPLKALGHISYLSHPKPLGQILKETHDIICMKDHF